jgi:hypothetical protein
MLSETVLILASADLCLLSMDLGLIFESPTCWLSLLLQTSKTLGFWLWHVYFLLDMVVL